MVFCFKNTGNTCYFNTALQMLLCTRAFTERIQHNRLEKKNTPKKKLPRVVDLIKNFNVKKTRVTTSGVHVATVNPRSLYEYYTDEFKVDRSTPEDCNECLIRLIDNLKESDPKTFDPMFSGEITETIGYDCRCRHTNEHREEFVSLNIVYDAQKSFSQNVRSFLENETFDVDYTCDKCKYSVHCVSKDKKITRLPSVLILNIVLPCRNTGVCNMLMMGEHKYFLKGASVYLSGHYNSCVFDHDTNKYVYVNDDHIENDDMSVETLGDLPYGVLVYERLV